MCKDRLFAASVVLLLLTARASAGMIVNGSFEIPAVTSGGFTNFLGGSTAITGWTVVGVDSAVVNGASQNGILFQAQDGNQWIDLAGVNSNSMTSGVSQDVTTLIGQDYNLNFYVGSATDSIFFFPATVDLSINGGTRVSYTNPTAPSNMLDWKLFTVSFAATSTKTNLTFFNGSATNNYLSGLDNVSLETLSAVPEPTSVVMWGLGAIGMAFAGRRKRKQQTLVV